MTPCDGLTDLHHKIYPASNLLQTDRRLINNRFGKACLLSGLLFAPSARTIYECKARMLDIWSLNTWTENWRRKKLDMSIRMWTKEITFNFDFTWRQVNGRWWTDQVVELSFYNPIVFVSRYFLLCKSGSNFIPVERTQFLIQNFQIFRKKIWLTCSRNMKETFFYNFFIIKGCSMKLRWWP